MKNPPYSEVFSVAYENFLPIHGPWEETADHSNQSAPFQDQARIGLNHRKVIKQ